VLSSLLLKANRQDKENFLNRGLKRVYLPLLERALHFPRITVSLAAGVFVLSLVIGSFIGIEFLPKLDEGAIAINVVRLPSASLDGSVAVGSFMEQTLLKFPEVKTVVTKTGRAEISEDPMGPEQNDVIIMLHPESEWKTGRNKEQLVVDMQKELSIIPGVRYSFSQPIALRVNELISGIKSDLAIKFFGPDLDSLKEYANKSAVVLQNIAGAEDVKIEQISGFSQIEIEIDRKAIARYKINVTDVNDLIETAVGGKVATMVVEDQMRFAVLVRFKEEYRASMEALGRLLVPSPDGPSVPLAQLATIRQVEAPAQISRENGMRRVVAECNIRGRDLGGFVAQTRDQLASLIEAMPPGYYVKFGGQFENQERAMQRLSIVVPLSIGLIFLMLFSTFGRLSSTLIVLANLPLALAGGIIILWIVGMPLTVIAVIGFIALFGSAVQNGTVLVAFFDQLRHEGLGVGEAVRRGCNLRFRPLMMTNMTVILGLVPMVLATGSGSEMQRPLALVVLGGLITSQALTLLVLPALYVWVEGRATRSAG
jgi:cobalt-zinc-cadmium resistance protein CzcA